MYILEHVFDVWLSFFVFEVVTPFWCSIFHIRDILLMDKILHHLTTLPWKGRIATPVPLIQCWRDPSEEVVQDFEPSTCFCFLTVVATMLTRENEGSKKSVRKVVQDFVHQQYGIYSLIIGFVIWFVLGLPLLWLV